MRRRACWRARRCSTDSSEKCANPSESPDGYFPEIRKAGFPCLPHYEKYNENNGLRGCGNLASTLRYKAHGHPPAELLQQARRQPMTTAFLPLRMS